LIDVERQLFITDILIMFDLKKKMTIIFNINILIREH